MDPSVPEPLEPAPDETPPMRRRLVGCFLPWPVSLAAFCVFMALVWFLTAGTRFDGTNYWSARTTAGWFILGLPVMAGIGLSCAAFVAFLARRVHKIAAGAALAALLALVAVSIRASTPERRLAAVIGNSAAAIAKIERLDVGDTFNAGETGSGVITGPRDLLDTIAHDRSLEVTRGTPPDARLRRCFPQSFSQVHLDVDSDDENLELGDQADDETSVFYLQPATGKIYFVWRSG